MKHHKHLKLHLGCGKRDFGSDWIHIDGDNYPHLHSHDIISLPFKDGTADLIYSAHTLEYFDRIEVLGILKEWKRVLKAGGVLRLAVPDFKSMMHLYLLGEVTLEQILGPLYGKWHMGDQIIYHKTTYDFVSLEKVLKSSGFINVRLYDWRLTKHADIDDHSRSHLPHDPEAIKTGNFTDKHTLLSLNVEAIKI